MTEIVADKTMVERVAEAIWMENRPEGAPPYEELDFLDQGRVKQIARACIKAMYEPTEEMETAGYKTSRGGTTAVDIYQEMIDAALEED